MIDCHTHCEFSFDTKTPAAEMVKAAIARGVQYLAITDHCDGDDQFCSNAGKFLPYIDTEAQFFALEKLKQNCAGKLSLAIGLELGFAREAQKYYKMLIAKHPYDIILNSVHLIEGEDCYCKEYYSTRTQVQAYTAYLSTVAQSVDADFSYDAITHIGYVSRKAPFADTRIYYNDYTDLFDTILSKIAAKGKALEINTNSKNTSGEFMPMMDIVKRFKQLGGQFITFGSDAHTSNRICEKYDTVAYAVKTIGFEYFVGFEQREMKHFKIN